MFTNKALRKLIVPLFLDQILIISIGIIATMMLSYASESAVSGVSLVDMINLLLISVLAALATGGAIVVSQYIGNREKEKACHAASQLMTVTAVISIGITLIVLLFHQPILTLLFGNIDKNVMATALPYFVLSALSYPFLAIYNSGAALFRSMEKSHIMMIVSMIMNVTNVILITIGIFIFHGGFIAVAIAALLARFLAAVIIFSMALNKKNLIFIQIKQILSWDKMMVKKILFIAIPNGIENGLVQLGRVLLISMIALFGTSQITANGITNSLVMISISFASAMNLAIVTVVGQCVGAGDYKQAIYYIKKLTVINYIVTFMISVLMILLLNQILDYYTLSNVTRNLTYTLIIIHNCFAIFLWPISFTLSNGLRAAGDVKFTMIIAIVSMFALRIFLAFLLGIVFGMGVMGVWIAMGLDWTFRAIVYVIRFKGEKWKSFRVV